MQIVSSGQGITSSSGVISFGFNASRIAIKATVNAVVSINADVISIDSSAHIYDQFDVDCAKLTVISGTIDYIAMG